ncbi:MAG: ABC transporter permease [Microbacterium sp.]|uniref:ABC transporter permease n=1 Tax=Microbacterium sp. TaxID=51671 RepID=UPI0039E298F3
MLRLIGRTILQTVVLLFIVTAVVFVLMSLVPGDAARAILGTTGTEEQYQQLREQLGLDLPLWQQYANYWATLFSGSFGTTLHTHQPVLTSILDRMPITLSLVVGATLVSTIVGILLGVLAATSSRIVRSAVDVVSLLGTALPSYWLAILGVMVFALAVPLLPATGYVDFWSSPVRWAQSLVLPVAALALGGVALIAKTTRDGMLRATNGLYARTLRAGGVSEGAIVWRHALKNSALPILPIVNVMFVSALGGSVFVESIFALNGLGSLIVTAVSAHEIYQVLGVAVIFTVFACATNLIVDVLLGVFDPRLKGGRA